MSENTLQFMHMSSVQEFEIGQIFGMLLQHG